jgi:hypothetical protein
MFLPNANGQDSLARRTHGSLGKLLVVLDRFHSSWRGTLIQYMRALDLHRLTAALCTTNLPGVADWAYSLQSASGPSP